MSPPFRFFSTVPLLQNLPQGSSDPSRFTPGTVALIVVSLGLGAFGAIVALVIYGKPGSTPAIASVSLFAAVLILQVMGVKSTQQTAAKADATLAAVQTIERKVNGELDAKLTTVFDKAKDAENRVAIHPGEPLPPGLKCIIDQTVEAAVTAACERMVIEAARVAAEQTAERLSNVQRPPYPPAPTDRPAPPDDRGFGGAT